jgi:hypothetical protein
MPIPFELVFLVAFQAVKLPASLVVDEKDEIPQYCQLTFISHCLYFF